MTVRVPTGSLYINCPYFWKVNNKSRYCVSAGSLLRWAGSYQVWIRTTPLKSIRGGGGVWDQQDSKGNGFGKQEAVFFILISVQQSFCSADLYRLHASGEGAVVDGRWFKSCGVLENVPCSVTTPPLVGGLVIWPLVEQIWYSSRF